MQQYVKYYFFIFMSENEYFWLIDLKEKEKSKAYLENQEQLIFHQLHS